MAKTYRPVDREQAFLLPPSMLDWLPEDHLVWFVIEAVARLDTSRFHARASLGGVGRRGYDPDMVLALLVYAMAHGESSSRQIERLCHTDVAFRVICAQDVPDHTVLARFRKDHEQALTDLLTESLVLAAELGMVSLGVVAFDGTKIAASASREANRGEAHLRKLAAGFVAAVAAADDAEDALFGEDRRGDGLPPGVGDKTHRGERIREALEQVAKRRAASEEAHQAQAERADAYERAMAGGPAPMGRPPKNADPVAVAKARWERELGKARARFIQHQARPRGRSATPPEQRSRVRKARAAYDAAQGAAGPGQPGTPETLDRLTANLTDPQSRLLKTRNGWTQGYNCQLAASADGFVICARATQDANDMEQFVPTMRAVTDAAERLARRTGRDDLTVGTLVGDAGYDSAANLAAEGPDRLIADANRRALDRRAITDPATGDPPPHASDREKTTHRLRTPEGVALYKRRAPMIEAANAWLKDGRGLRRFSRRGLPAAQAELAFACAVTNLRKLATKGVTAAQLRTA
jgi:transposase